MKKISFFRVQINNTKSFTPSDSKAFFDISTLKNYQITSFGFVFHDKLYSLCSKIKKKACVKGKKKRMRRESFNNTIKLFLISSFTFFFKYLFLKLISKLRNWHWLYFSLFVSSIYLSQNLIFCYKKKKLPFKFSFKIILNKWKHSWKEKLGWQRRVTLQIVLPKR